MPDIKKGIVELVSMKTKGIRFKGEEDWYNPSERAKDFVNPELKGKEVEITLTDRDKEFSYIKASDLPQTRLVPESEPRQERKRETRGERLNDGAFFGMVFNQTCEQMRMHNKERNAEEYKREFRGIFNTFWDLGKELRKEKGIE